MKTIGTSLRRILVAALLLGLGACASEPPMEEAVPEPEVILHEPAAASPESVEEPGEEDPDKKRRHGGDSDDMDRVN